MKHLLKLGDLSPAEILHIGIPARKAARVMAELARISAADPALRGRDTMLALAKAIARQLV